MRARQVGCIVWQGVRWRAGGGESALLTGWAVIFCDRVRLALQGFSLLRTVLIPLTAFPAVRCARILEVYWRQTHRIRFCKVDLDGPARATFRPIHATIKVRSVLPSPAGDSGRHNSCFQCKVARQLRVFCTRWMHMHTRTHTCLYVCIHSVTIWMGWMRVNGCTRRTRTASSTAICHAVIDTMRARSDFV